MKKETLFIEFTGKQELEVYDRLQREVDEWWNKLQETQIPKSGALQSRKAIEEMIVMRALDKFLPQLSAKERLEMQTGQKFSDVLFNALIEMDRRYLKEKLKAMCKKAGLSVSGDKKELAWKLLRREVETANRESE